MTLRFRHLAFWSMAMVTATASAGEGGPGERLPPPPEQAERVMARIEPKNVRRFVDTLAGFGTRHTLSDATDLHRGIGVARQWVKRELDSFNAAAPGGPGNLKTMLEAHRIPPGSRRMPDGGEVVNVVAVLPGTMPEAADRRYYIVAHLDSRNSDGMDTAGDAPGANDDGSGVAALMEVARALAGEKLDATVVFLATAGEEQGLYGARAHAIREVEAGRDIRAVLSNDTVGDPTGPPRKDGTPREARGQIRVFCEGLSADMLAGGEGGDAGRGLATGVRFIRSLSAENDGGSRQLARYIAEVAQRHDTAVKPMVIYRPDRFLRGGDHTPFNELGVAAVRLCEVYEDYNRQHQDPRVEGDTVYGDLPEFVDADYLADVARLNAAVLVHLANAPSTPRNARLIVAELSNDTTLRWDRSPEPDVAGYEVVWRETTSPVWQHSQDVGDAAEGTIDLSKDNWFFGVRAYDKDGYRSPVAFPVAANE